MTTDEDQVPELTAEDARAEVERLSTELYWAQDRIAFVSECLDACEHDGITTLPVTRVRRWLDGPRCSHQTCAAAPEHSELRKRIAAAIGRIGLVLPIGHRLAAADHVLHALRPTLAQAARLEPAIVEQERQTERADRLTTLLTVILDNDSDLLPAHRVTQIEAYLSPDHGQHCHAPRPDLTGVWTPDPHSTIKATKKLLERRTTTLRRRAERAEASIGRVRALRGPIAEALEQADYSGNMRRGDLADSIMPVINAALDGAVKPTHGEVPQ